MKCGGRGCESLHLGYKSTFWHSNRIFPDAHVKKWPTGTKSNEEYLRI